MGFWIVLGSVVIVAMLVASFIPAKRVIVTPVKDLTAISQQSFVADKSYLDLFWGSGIFSLLRLGVDIIGLLSLWSWLS